MRVVDQRQLAQARIASASACARSGTRTSMLYGLVSGEFFRSASVRIASVLGSLVCSGSESKVSRGNRAAPRTASAAKAASTGRAARNSRASSRSPQAKPIARASPSGRNSVRAAGRNAERAGECDQHADAGDQPEFRHAAEVGGHEGQEAGRGGGGGDQDLRADTRARWPTAPPRRCRCPVASRR